MNSQSWFGFQIREIDDKFYVDVSHKFFAANRESSSGNISRTCVSYKEARATVEKLRKLFEKLNGEEFIYVTQSSGGYAHVWHRGRFIAVEKDQTVRQKGVRDHDYRWMLGELERLDVRVYPY